METSERERGQAVPMMLVVLTLLVGLVLAVAKAGELVTDASGAQNTADAVALAGVSGGKDGAEMIARENEARLVSFQAEDGEVQVTVEKKGKRATARAAPGPPRFAHSG